MRALQQLSPSDGELALRLALAMVLCGAIGVERETRGQVAGMRTHILVGVGATLFTLVSAYGFLGYYAAGAGIGNVAIRLDPTRIAAQIVSGIGFLGAGAIIRQGFAVRGVTTAAALWIDAAIGMAVGAGYYGGAAITTAIVLLTLVGLKHFRLRLRPFTRDTARLDVRIAAHGSVAAALQALEDLGAEVAGVESKHNGHAVNVSVRLPDDLSASDIVAHLERLSAVDGVVVTGRT